MLIIFALLLHHASAPPPWLPPPPQGQDFLDKIQEKMDAAAGDLEEKMKGMSGILEEKVGDVKDRLFGLGDDWADFGDRGAKEAKKMGEKMKNWLVRHRKENRSHPFDFFRDGMEEWANRSHPWPKKSKEELFSDIHEMFADSPVDEFFTEVEAQFDKIKDEGKLQATFEKVFGAENKGNVSAIVKKLVKHHGMGLKMFVHKMKHKMDEFKDNPENLADAVSEELNKMLEHNPMEDFFSRPKKSKEELFSEIHEMFADSPIDGFFTELQSQFDKIKDESKLQATFEKVFGPDSKANVSAIVKKLVEHHGMGLKKFVHKMKHKMDEFKDKPENLADAVSAEFRKMLEHNPMDDFFTRAGDWFEEKGNRSFGSIEDLFDKGGEWFDDDASGDFGRMEDLFDSAEDWFEDMKESSGDKEFFDRAGEWFHDDASGDFGGIEDLFDSVEDWFEDMGESSGGGDFLDKAGEWFEDDASGDFGGMKDFFADKSPEQILKIGKEWAAKHGKNMQDFAGDGQDFLSNIFAGSGEMPNFIKNLFDNVAEGKEWWKNFFGDLVDGENELVEGIQGKVKEAHNHLTNLFENLVNEHLGSGSGGMMMDPLHDHFGSGDGAPMENIHRSGDAGHHFDKLVKMILQKVAAVPDEAAKGGTDIGDLIFGDDTKFQLNKYYKEVFGEDMPKETMDRMAKDFIEKVDPAITLLLKSNDSKPELPIKDGDLPIPTPEGYKDSVEKDKGLEEMFEDGKEATKHPGKSAEDKNHGHSSVAPENKGQGSKAGKGYKDSVEKPNPDVVDLFKGRTTSGPKPQGNPHVDGNHPHPTGSGYKDFVVTPDPDVIKLFKGTLGPHPGVSNVHDNGKVGSGHFPYPQPTGSGYKDFVGTPDPDVVELFKGTLGPHPGNSGSGHVPYPHPTGSGYKDFVGTPDPDVVELFKGTPGPYPGNSGSGHMPYPHPTGSGYKDFAGTLDPKMAAMLKEKLSGFTPDGNGNLPTGSGYWSAFSGFSPPPNWDGIFPTGSGYPDWFPTGGSGFPDWFPTGGSGNWGDYGSGYFTGVSPYPDWKEFSPHPDGKEQSPETDKNENKWKPTGFEGHPFTGEPMVKDRQWQRPSMTDAPAERTVTDQPKGLLKALGNSKIGVKKGAASSGAKKMRQKFGRRGGRGRPRK